jgi:YbbR domain-containing protein
VRRLTNNFGLKALSLLLAVLLSAYVYLYINYPTTDVVYLPLKTGNLSSKLVIVKQDPPIDKVLVRLRGPYRSIRQIASLQHTAVLDCTDVTGPGQATLRVNLPRFGDVVAVDQDPGFVDVQAEWKRQKRLKIAVARQGEVDRGFVVGAQSVSVSWVDVSGAESLVERVQQAQVEPDVSGVRGDLVANVPVLLYDGNGARVEGPALRLTPSEVRYELRLVATANVRVLNVVPDYHGLPPAGFFVTELTAEPTTIPVPAELVPAGALTVRTGAVELSGARETFSAPADLLYPFSVPKDSGLPRECTVEVAIAALGPEEAGAVVVGIQLRGANQHFDYALSSPQVAVRSLDLASARREQLQGIVAVVEVGDLGPGEHRVAPQVTLPPDVGEVTITPSTIMLSVMPSGK